MSTPPLPASSRILVVEDTPANIQVLTATLKERGYQKLLARVHTDLTTDRLPWDNESLLLNILPAGTAEKLNLGYGSGDLPPFTAHVDRRVS
jgi:hypothetical protein